MSLPNVAEAFWDWTTYITFQIVRTTVADGEVTEVADNALTFDAVLQPLPPQRLMVKPENQRSWRWWSIYTTFQMNPGQVIQDPAGLQFRIMAVSNWQGAGHFEYEAVQAPTVGQPIPVQG